MGDASETVKRQAQEFLDEKSRPGRAAVRDAMSAVPEAAGQAMREVTDKVARVADAGRKELAQEITEKRPNLDSFSCGFSYANVLLSVFAVLFCPVIWAFQQIGNYSMSIGTIILIILVIILLGGFSGYGGGPFYGTGYYGGGGLGVVIVIILILILLGRI